MNLPWTPLQIETLPFLFIETKGNKRCIRPWQVYYRLRRHWEEDESGMSSSSEANTNNNITWRNLSKVYKDAFTHRASLLNKRPKVGMMKNPFVVLNVKASEQSKRNALCILGDTIRAEVERTRKATHRVLVNGRRCNKESNKLYTLGKEKIRVGSHLFQILAVPSIVVRCIFGKQYEKLDKDLEIVSKTENRCIIHVASANRMCELMNIDGIILSQAETEYHKFEFTGKIVLRPKSFGTEIVGYIKSESSAVINIITRGGEQIQMKRPFYNKEQMKYAYGSHGECTIYDFNRMSDSMYEVIEYHPIRIIISNTAQLNFKLLSHRYGYEREGNNSIVETLCSCKFNVHVNTMNII